MQCRPDVLGDADRLIGAPEQATAEKAGEEEHAVIPLRAGAGHVELIEEPVEIEERGGKLVEDEGRAVEVDERSLTSPAISHTPLPASQGQSPHLPEKESRV